MELELLIDAEIEKILYAFLIMLILEIAYFV